MGRTIITENDVRDAAQIRNYVTRLDVLESLIEVAHEDVDREALERLIMEMEAEKEEEQEAEEEPRTEEPENEDELERQRPYEPPPPPAPASPYEPPPLMEEALSQTTDYYTDILLKYIPAESVALYLTLQGMVLSSVEAPALNAWLWVAFGIGIIGTPLYLWRIQQVSKRMQLAVSTVAFGVWVFALGGAFAALSWYEPFLGSVMLVVFTFFAPLISPDALSSEEAA